MKRKIVVGVTGASGAIYAENLLAKLQLLKDQIEEIALIISDNGKAVWEYELSENYELRIRNYDLAIKNYSNTDMFAAVASGSAGFDTMIVCPCSMGTLGKIANGTSDNLIIRAADVMLKERKKLILVTREMPLSLIHIRNMESVTLAGGIICPASPSFYSKPEKLEDAVNTVIEKILSVAGFEFDRYKWREER